MNSEFHQTFFKHFFKLATAFFIVIGSIFVLSPFLVPFFFGGMLALALSPFLQAFMRKYNWTKKKALVILSMFLFFVFALPVTIFFIRGSRIIAEFFTKQSVSGITQKTQNYVYGFLDNFSSDHQLEFSMVKEKFDTFLENAGSFILKTFSDLAAQIPDLLLGFLVMMLSFYFFLLKEDQIRRGFDRYFYFSKDHADKFIAVLKSSCREVFFSNVITGVLQSSIVAFGALACGIGDFYILFFFTFIISFIPIIGAAPMAFVIALYAFLNHQTGEGIAMSIIGVVSGVSDNLIRPYLVSLGEVEVPAFIGFLAVIGGVIIMGLPGLFVGPLLASMVYGVLPIIFDEYFPPKLPSTQTEEELIESP